MFIPSNIPLQFMRKLDSDLCYRITMTPGISNATARIAAWIHGAATQAGGYPIEVTMRQIQNGAKVGQYDIPGTGCRVETIKQALDWLESNGWLLIEEGSVTSFKTHAKRLTLCS